MFDDWVIIAELILHHFLHYELLLYLCQNLGIVTNWEKSDLDSKGLVSWDADRRNLGEGISD